MEKFLIPKYFNLPGDGWSIVWLGYSLHYFSKKRYPDRKHPFTVMDHNSTARWRFGFYFNKKETT